MNKAVIDTCALLYAWDNYPIKQFPKVWDLLARLITNGDIVILKIVEDELKGPNEIEDGIKDDDCFIWISKYAEHERTPEIEGKAKEIEGKLGIVDSKYRRKAVGKNDIRIIAFAAIENLDVITNESAQEVNRGSKPPEKKNYKIPRVCEEVVKIRSYDFLTLLVESEEVF